MAHSRNDLIREGVQAEVDNSAKTMEDAEGHVQWVMTDEDIVDLVMRHVDPLLEEIHHLQGQGVLYKDALSVMRGMIRIALDEED